MSLPFAECLSENASSVKGISLLDAFRRDAPVIGDNYFECTDNVVIVPGSCLLESYIVKSELRGLVKGNVFGMFSDPIGNNVFSEFELVGILQIVEDLPQICSFVEVQTDPDDDIPKLMRLVSTTSVLAFNDYGLQRFAKDLLSRLPSAVVSLQCNRSGAVKGSSVDRPVFPTNTPGDTSLRARQNAEKTQLARVLFRHDEELIRKYFGKLDEVDGPRVQSAVQGILLESQTKFIIMQAKNIPKFAQLFFQRTDTSEGSKPVSGLHVSQFRNVGTQLSSYYQVRLCVENMVRVLQQFVGGDDDSFISDIFTRLVAKLNSSEPNSLSTMDYSLVLDVVSEALVRFSQVLASERAFGAKTDVLVGLLRQALEIDVEEVGKRDIRLKVKSLSQAANPVAKKPRYGEGPVGAGRGGRIPLIGPGGHAGTNNYCIAQVCFAYLGSKKFDGQAPLVACPGINSWCKFNHATPVVPVSKVELTDLTRVARIISPKQPGKRAALDKVFASPTFVR